MADKDKLIKFENGYFKLSQIYHMDKLFISEVYGKFFFSGSINQKKYEHEDWGVSLDEEGLEKLQKRRKTFLFDYVNLWKNFLEFNGEKAKGLLFDHNTKIFAHYDDFLKTMQKWNLYFPD